MSESKHLIVGLGEIGKPIFKILSEVCDVESFDQLDRGFNNPSKSFDAIHICFGHKKDEVEDFKKWVRDYQKEFLKEGGLTIIHSTTAVGVSKALEAVHSPVRGMHPNMEEGIRTFVKFFGGERASEAAEYFRRAGLKIMLFDTSETTEAMKLFDTEYYHTVIKFCQRVKKYCDEHDLNFSDVYRLANITYNQGYIELGHSEYVRPVLEPIKGPIKGHCVVSNSKLIALSE